ncbi:MAG: hypothetical protein U1D31_01250 [Patescibacteria group bacterium]|nr:hypothetical protein [bacterium]MDZ4240742.1 hypothetical protein [Patescibacteria group bacterium]
MKKALALTATIAAPALAFAQLGNVEDIISAIGSIVTLLIPIAFSAALLFFFWGLAQYILSAGNEEAKAQGRNMMIWGIVALFVMASVWGLVAFIGDALGIDQSGDIDVPGVLNN